MWYFKHWPTLKVKQLFPTAIYYALPLHLQEVYKYLKYKSGDFPQSKREQEQVLTLPMYPELSEEQIELVVQSVRNL